jgi:Ala-tRNA(Pro) deacylase
MFDIEAFLRQHDISFQRFDHPAVFTCEESERLCPPMPGAHTKNLFLRDGKGKRYFLVVVGHTKSVDLKSLKALLNADKLSFAAPEKMQEYIGVLPGSATILGLVADTNHVVEVFIDEEIWNADIILCHPLVNTATVAIAKKDIEKFLTITGHTFSVIDVPARELAI